MTFDDAILVIYAMADDLPTVSKGQLCQRAAQHIQNVHLAVIKQAEEFKAALAKLQAPTPVVPPPSTPVVTPAPP